MQLPPRQLRGLVESGHFGFCGALQEQSDRRADEKAGSVCRCLQPLCRRQRHAEGTPEAGGGPPSYIRAHQVKRHEVIYILNFVFVHLEFFGTRLCCSCDARNIFVFLYSVFVFQSLIIRFYILVFCIFRYVCGCFLPIHSGHQNRWTYQPGSHRRKVTQDFSSTFLLRCVP